MKLREQRIKEMLVIVLPVFEYTRC